VPEYAKVRLLPDEPAPDIEGILRTLATRLAKSGEKASIGVRLVGDPEPQVWFVDFRKPVAQVERVTDPKGKYASTVAFEVITKPDTWRAIASALLSPIDAFLGGELRFRGDAELAKKLMRYLATSKKDIVDPC
jgi:hypothetical protein